MRIKTVSATYERKFNLGNYNSVNIGVTMWADCEVSEDEPEEDPNKVATELMNNCREHVREEAQSLYLSITENRRLGTDTMPTAVSKGLSEFQGVKYTPDDLK